MAKSFAVIGTNPMRVHYFATAARLELVAGKPAIRIRDDDEGLIFVFASVAGFREYAEGMLAVADKLEADDVAAAEKQAADVFAKIKAKGNEDEPK